MYSILRKHLGILVFWGIFFGILSGAVTFFFPFQYSAVSQILIISRDRSGVDPYTQAKSAERVSQNLAEVIKTSDFYSKVMNLSNANFDKSAWNKLTERKQRRKWQRDVKPETVYGTSLLRITTYALTPDEVRNFNKAVAETLTSRGFEYIGGDVVLKQVDDPLVSRFPTRPNLPVNFLAGSSIGVLLSSFWVVRNKKHNYFGR